MQDQDDNTVDVGKVWWFWFSSSAFDVDKRLRRMLPSDPRCKFCTAPFRGVGGSLVRAVFGKQQSVLNPRFCNMCDEAMRRFPGGAEVEMSMLFAGPDYVQKTVRVARQLSALMQQQEIPVGIGVHARLAYFGAVGTPGELTKMTAVGEEVNVAARLASKAAAGEVIVSETALQKAGLDGSHLESRSLDLKGITEKMSVRVMHGDQAD